MFSTIITALPQFSYAGLFIFLAAGAILVPLPEEVTVLAAGYLIYSHVLLAWIAVPIAIFGLLTGDTILFLLARFGGSYAQKLRARVNKIGLEKTWIFSPKQPLRAVFLLRFITGIRFIAPIYAGFEGVSYRSYLLTDFISICIYVPSMFFIGYEFHASLLAFIAIFEIVRHGLLLILLAIVGGGVLPELYQKGISKTKRTMRAKREEF